MKNGADKVAIAESALLLTSISREYAKPEGDRNGVFAKKCSEILLHADEENRGPEELKLSLLAKAREKAAKGSNPDTKKKTRLIRAAVIAAAAVLVLVSCAVAMKVFIPYYVNHYVTEMDNYNEAVNDPDSELTRDEAVKLAYDFAAKTYGDYIYDFRVLNVNFHPPKNQSVILGKSYQAKDFLVYGPECRVDVYVNGEIGLCIYDGSDDSEVQDLVSGISKKDLKEILDSGIADRYGDEAKKYDIAGLAVRFDGDKPMIEITARPWLKATDYPDLSEEEFADLQFKLSGGYLDEYYDYYLKEKILKVTKNSPEGGITREEAVDLAYREMAQFQGERYNDLVVVNAEVKDDLWTIVLAKEFQAKDFKVYGLLKTVFLRPNGELYSVRIEPYEEESEILRRIENVSSTDIEKFVSDQLPEGKDDFEITDVCYNQNEYPYLRIGVRLGPDSVVYYDYEMEW